MAINGYKVAKKITKLIRILRIDSILKCIWFPFNIKNGITPQNIIIRKACFSIIANSWIAADKRSIRNSDKIL
jgi:hypothetical protein